MIITIFRLRLILIAIKWNHLVVFQFNRLHFSFFIKNMPFICLFYSVLDFQY